MTNARDRILAEIGKHGFYTTRTKAEMKEAVKLHSEGTIRSIANVGSKTTAKGSTFLLLECH